MRRLAITSLLIALASTIAAVVATAALAAPSVRVSFMVEMTSYADGALINSSVPGCPTATITTPEAGWFFRGNVGHFWGEHAFDCGAGNTFTLSYIAHRAPVDSPTNRGTWKIVEGTGIYSGLQGGGTLSATGTPGADTFVDYYTGMMQLP